MKSDDTARTFYNSARAELIERIRLRDQIFVFYLAGVVAVFGLALGTSGGAPNREDILLFLPLIGLGASVIISQHFAVIGALGAYCVLDVGPFLRAECAAPQWDESDSLKTYHEAAITLRTWGHVLLILIPSAGALALRWRHGIFSPFPMGLLWWIGFGCLVISGWVMWKTHQFRKTLQERKESIKKEPNKAPEAPAPSGRGSP